MANPIRTADLRRVFQPVLGTRFTAETPLCDHVAELLRRYAPGRIALSDLAKHVRTCIFEDLYQLLGPHMTLQSGTGQRRRVLLDEIDALADESMGVLLRALPEADLPLDALRDYAMDTGSLTAMRILVDDHGDALSPMEQEVIRRILRENRPATGFERPMQ